jgi:hypothetical protein
MTTPFRNDVDELKSRLTYIDNEVSALRAKSAEYEEVRERLAKLERERDELQRKIDARSPRAKGPLLDTLRIASPCKESWEGMVGDDRTRFCKRCDKDVHNVSAMTRVEAESFLQSVSGSVCVQMFKREDGTILTADCPVGARRKHVRRLVLAVVGSGLAATAGVLAFWRTDIVGQGTMGDMAVGKMTAEPTVGTAAPVVDTAPPPVTAPSAPQGTSIRGDFSPRIVRAEDHLRGMIAPLPVSSAPQGAKPESGPGAPSQPAR